MGWEIMNHPPYSPDLAPSDFVPVKVQQEDKYFKLMINPKALPWLCSQDKNLYAALISNIVRTKENYVSVLGNIWKRSECLATLTCTYIPFVKVNLESSSKL
jgi:hypothetical protein